MIDAFAQINWIGVALATVVAVVLGGVYFAALMPQQYVRALGREDQPASKTTPVSAVGPLVCMVAVVVTSAVLIAAAGVTTVGEAIAFGLVVGVGYLVAMTFQIAINPNFPHPIRYGVLNTPYFLVVSLATSLIMVLV